MTPRHLVLEEIVHRKWAFVLGLFAVGTAVTVLVAQFTLIEAHDLETTRILTAKEAVCRAEMARMEDDYRKITKKLGFNLLILPADQPLSDYYAGGIVTHDMPETFAGTLADSSLMTIRHLLPTLERRIAWPEQGGRPLILVGTRGEVPPASSTSGTRRPKAPIMTAVPPGKAVVGHSIWTDLDLRQGDTITVLGHLFRIAARREERGSRDDVTIWVDLAEAQQMLGARGRITGILALKCECAGNELATIRTQVAKILPGAQVIEITHKVVTRAETRARAHQAALDSLAAEREHRRLMRIELQAHVAWSGPLVVLAAAVWVCLLALINVRERRSEIGILRALGVRTSRLAVILLSRAGLVGLGGALLGIAAGLVVGVGRSESGLDALALIDLARPLRLLTILAAAPLVAAIASWIPVLSACRQDPAVVLREE